MKFLKIGIITLVFLMSIGAVCATDALSVDIESNGQEISTALGGELYSDSFDDLETADDEIYGNGETSFTALQEVIKNASEGSTINLEHDYEYDSGFTVDGIKIEKNEITLNGNGHTINALNQARIFNISGESITISNLNIINGFSEENGGAIFSASDATFIDVAFINNNAKNGGAIYITAIPTIEGCTFDNNTAADFAGCIGSTREVTVSNSTFINSKSKSSTAIYVYGEMHARASIVNSTFENLTAEQSAGAIGIKNLIFVEIINCTFKNTSSKKNGGAAFLESIDDFYDATIENSTFINSCGDYGGALVILGAQPSIKNCEFINNTALYSGGAIYASNCEITINNTLINGNKLIYDDYGNGGGIYADYSTTNVVNCTIINNTKNGIYAYDKELKVKNTKFADNTEAIHGVFLDYKLINVKTGNDTLFLNETYYPSVVNGTGKELILFNNTIDVVTLPSRFDSREWDWVTPVKNQGDSGFCWAFATCAALESALLKATGIKYDLSVNNMANAMLKYSMYGIKSEFEGGIEEQGMEYLLSWFGTLPEKYDTFDEIGKLSPIISTNETIHILDTLIVGHRKNSTDNDALKRAIIKCGAVATGINTDGYDDNASFYQNFDNGTGHLICLVGWDDNYSASNFLTTPPGDGAFILKNSWGEEMGDHGYFYISYYDVSLLNETYAIGFLIENTESYIRNYQYDLSGKIDRIENNGSIISYRNSYQSVGNELLSAVGTYFNENEDYSLEIYVNNKLVHTQSGISQFGGYHSIKLTKAIPIALNDIFTVVMNKTSLTLFKDSRQHYINGTSQYLENGTWVNASDNHRVCCLKAYTVADDTEIINNEDIAVDYDGGKYFSVKVVTDDGHAVGTGANVTFTINKKTKTVTTSDKGIAKIKITQNPGKYSITTTYKGKSVKNTVTIKHVITATKCTVKKTAKSFALKAKLKINGKLIKGKTITFKFNGKTYKIKTNSKGIAKKVLNKNVIKKLKKGKTYTVKVTYRKDTVKTTVKVR